MNVDRAEIDVKYSYYDKFYPGVKDVAEVRVRVRKYVSPRTLVMLCVCVSRS